MGMVVLRNSVVDLVDGNVGKKRIVEQAARLLA